MRAILVLACIAGLARADAYAPQSRVEYLGTALHVLRGLGVEGRKAFDGELHAAVRARCRGAEPATSCLVEVARAVCGGQRARCAAADVVLANEHAASDLIDEPTRMRLVRASSDYHAAINAELWKKYALLAAELALFDGAGDEAARIDRFCVEREQQVHRCEAGAKACVPNVAWQRCAAGLVWFVAGRTK